MFGLITCIHSRSVFFKIILIARRKMEVSYNLYASSFTKPPDYLVEMWHSAVLHKCITLVFCFADFSKSRFFRGFSLFMINLTGRQLHVD
jgi:hypothetical protein